MNLILMSMMLIALMSTMILMMIFMLSKKSMIDSQKMNSFECGFNTMSLKRMPFSIHFFLIAVLFLIFDIEIIIIMPMMLTMKFSLTMNWLLTISIFILLITMGLYHEWYNGMLNWTN
uniref:NADH-ubiquinone oxidoreductase chain 3 n=1 Tax=Signoretia aureola TaxID=2901393 RepID=A0A8K2ATZ0_9HEMI|nr:NADH dehydrogenase subunit 3 [Signoretia aureola]